MSTDSDDAEVEYKIVRYITYNSDSFGMNI